MQKLINLTVSEGLGTIAGFKQLLQAHPHLMLDVLPLDISTGGTTPLGLSPLDTIPFDMPFLWVLLAARVLLSVRLLQMPFECSEEKLWRSKLLGWRGWLMLNK